VKIIVGAFPRCLGITLIFILYLTFLSLYIYMYSHRENCADPLPSLLSLSHIRPSLSSVITAGSFWL